jgi:hypothetical protein
MLPTRTEVAVTPVWSLKARAGTVGLPELPEPVAEEPGAVVGDDAAELHAAALVATATHTPTMATRAFHVRDATEFP